jgi:hypothetical protein
MLIRIAGGIAMASVLAAFDPDSAASADCAHAGPEGPTRMQAASGKADSNARAGTETIRKPPLIGLNDPLFPGFYE